MIRYTESGLPKIPYYRKYRIKNKILFFTSRLNWQIIPSLPSNTYDVFYNTGVFSNNLYNICCSRYFQNFTVPSIYNIFVILFELTAIISIWFQYIRTIKITKNRIPLKFYIQPLRKWFVIGKSDLCKKWSTEFFGKK